MDLKRRDFLKIVAAGGAAASTSGVATAMDLSRDPKVVPKDAVGWLYDSTECIGCQACVTACKESNDLPKGGTPENIWKEYSDLTNKIYNTINLYKDGTGEDKDHEKNGFAFIKNACHHCVDPSCVSACPVSGLVKDEKTGVVVYNPDACCGCRYCMVACPYNVPRFEFKEAFPQIRKCQLCDHKEGDDYSACAASCPTGATVYGTYDQLIEEAKRRLKLKAGDSYKYPIGRIGDGKFVNKTLKVNYVQQIYGENEVGGSQCLFLSGVDFEKMGKPKLPKKANSALVEGLQHTLYKGMIAPIVFLGGLLTVVYKNTSKHDDQ